MVCADTAYSPSSEAVPRSAYRPAISARMPPCPSARLPRLSQLATCTRRRSPAMDERALAATTGRCSVRPEISTPRSAATTPACATDSAALITSPCAPASPPRLWMVPRFSIRPASIRCVPAESIRNSFFRTAPTWSSPRRPAEIYPLFRASPRTLSVRSLPAPCLPPLPTPPPKLTNVPASTSTAPLLAAMTASETTDSSSCTVSAISSAIRTHPSTTSICRPGTTAPASSSARSVPLRNSTSWTRSATDGRPPSGRACRAHWSRRW
ncbi:Uncharacterised protein [Bordetella pertussis]|nr:Uncharacterised protein [Bordetella pertussis]